MTKQYGILAYPARHSLSPAVHDAAFKCLKIDAQFGFFETPESEIPSFIESVLSEPISGLAVSLPYKELVMNYMNKIDEDALKIGAVNTVVNKGGMLYAYNTDWIGVQKALEESVGDFSGMNAVVIGAGGAARGVIYALLKGGAKVGVYNRTEEKAQELAKYFGDLFGVMVESGGIDKIDSGDILINTTSIWLENEEAKVEDLMLENVVGRFKTVMDIVYKPLITPLLAAAQKAGSKVITGDKMFLYQAAAQCELWTGEKAPIEVMRETLNNCLL